MECFICVLFVFRVEIISIISKIYLLNRYKLCNIQQPYLQLKKRKRKKKRQTKNIFCVGIHIDVSLYIETSNLMNIQTYYCNILQVDKIFKSLLIPFLVLEKMRIGINVYVYLNQCILYETSIYLKYDACFTFSTG